LSKIEHFSKVSSYIYNADKWFFRFQISGVRKYKSDRIDRMFRIFFAFPEERQKELTSKIKNPKNQACPPLVG